MNLEQSVSLESLRTVRNKKPEKQRLSALAMARRIFKISAEAGHPYRHITPEQWAHKWLSSPTFILTEVETDRVALIRTPRNVNKVLRDMQASADSLEPVVVDLNKNKLSAKNGYVPSVVAVDGAHRCYGQYLQGRDLMKAWVGTKALERVRPEPLIQASAIPTSNVTSAGTKLSTAAALYAAQGMPAPARQDSGDGGSQPTGRVPTVMRSGAPDGPDYIKNRGIKSHGKDCRCSACSSKMEAAGGAGGAGAGAGAGGGAGAGAGMGGPGASLGQGSGPTLKTSKKSMEARTPEARSAGQLEEPDPSDEKVPLDPSDAKQSVDPSDRLQYKQEAQTKPPGVRQNQKIAEKGYDNPASQSPGSGSGPRIKATRQGPRVEPSKGASNSELQRTMDADCDICGSDLEAAGRKIKKIVTQFKAAIAKGYVPTLKSKAPPGCEDAVMGLKKSKVDNPFAVAWWMKNEGRC